MSFGMKIGTKLLQCGLTVLFLSSLNAATAQHRAPQRSAAAGQARITKAIQDLGAQIKNLAKRVKRLEAGQRRGSTRSRQASRAPQARSTLRYARRDASRSATRRRQSESKKKQAGGRNVQARRRAEQAKKRKVVQVRRKTQLKKKALAKKLKVNKKLYAAKKAKSVTRVLLPFTKRKGKAPLRVYELRQPARKKAPSLGTDGILCPECIKRIRQLHQSHSKGVGKLPGVMLKLGNKGLSVFPEVFPEVFLGKNITFHSDFPAPQIIQLEIPSISSKVFELKLQSTKAKGKKASRKKALKKKTQFLRLKAPGKRKSKARRPLNYRKSV